MREGFLGRAGAAGRPAGHASGAMDAVSGMEVGAEIEVTEDGTLEELPLHLENAKNYLSWESLDVSSSDDDGEEYLSFYLPVRRPPRAVQRTPIRRLQAQRMPAQRSAAPASAMKPPACENRLPPMYPCPLRPSIPSSPGIPAFDAYQCQKCLQVFMEEWHYAQHLQDHVQEESEQQQAMLQQQEQQRRQLRPRPHSPPRKLRCLECGKRFLRPEHFARHTKWHLKLVRKGIKVCHRKGSRRSSQVSYVYKALSESPLGGEMDASGLPVVQESLRQPKGLQPGRPLKANRRKALRHHKKLATEVSQAEGLLSSTCPGNSIAILDGEGGVNLLQPWQKQEAILEGQVAGAIYQPAVLNAENQIIILDDAGAEAVPVVPDHHYTEVQTTVLDSQGNMNEVRPLFLQAEEQATLLDSQAGLNSLQFGSVKDQTVVEADWAGQNPCTLFRTVLLQTEEQTATVDSQMESSALQQVIIKTSDGSPAFYLDQESHLSSLDSATLHFVPLHQESQFVTVPYGNTLTLDHAEPTDGEKTWESQTTTFQLPDYLPNVPQQNKLPSPSATTGLSPKGPQIVRFVPGTSEDRPEVLDLEYDTGGGIPVASEPWEPHVQSGQEAYLTEEVVENNIIVVEIEGDSCGQESVVDIPHKSSRRRAFHRTRKPTIKNRLGRFKCPDCGVCYSRMCQLRFHQKGSKRRGRSYLCECGALFRGLLHLLRHQLQHLEEALFICSTCGKSLQGHRRLARHGTCKPDPARFSCSCGVSFQRLSRYLWHHVRSQKPGLRVYTLSGFLSSA
ncbi:hypothetical protein JD844_005739 [Phrynosoma platyrhinos]|uniref:C2H2-type domain-containing protein n=1 Tax=Phrynosoma platyrhinos TaxID=52577 RepID=A0ABQ7TNZ1_PHRPL|nr:hypothetical protein JD844_005739 [Phrynosoma platyrhinos]